METIGIKLADGSFYPILEDGKAQAKNLLLTTVKDNQTIVHVDLYRSKLGSMEDAVYVDTLEIQNLNPHGNGEPSLNLDIALDENNELNAQIKDPETGTQSERKVSLVLRSELERDSPVNFSIEESDPDKNPFEDMFADDEEEPEELSDQSFEDIVNSISNTNVEGGANSPTLVTEEEFEQLDSKETVLGSTPDSEDFAFDDLEQQPQANDDATLDQSSDIPVTDDEDKTLLPEEPLQDDSSQSSDFDIQDYIQEPEQETIDVTDDVQKDGIFEQLESLPLADDEYLAQKEQQQEPEVKEESIVPDTFDVTDNVQTQEALETIEPLDTQEATPPQQELEPLEDINDIESTPTQEELEPLDNIDAIDNIETPVTEESQEIQEESQETFATEELSQESSTNDSAFDDFTQLEKETESMSNPFIDMDLPSFEPETKAEPQPTAKEEANSFELPELQEIANSVEDIDTSFELPSFDTPPVASGTSYVSDVDNFEVPDFDDTDNAFEPIKPESTLDFDDIFDEPVTSSSKDNFATSTSSDFSSKDMFSDLYDKETMEGKSSTAYDDDFYSEKRKTKLPVIICVACAVICIFCLATFLVKRGNKTSLVATTTNTTSQTSEQTEKIEEKDSTTVVATTKVAEKPAEVQKVEQEDTSARENEIVIATEFSKVVPEPPVKQNTKQEAIRYKVNWGDTLWDIANAFYKNPWRYTELAKYNNIQNPNYIKTGSYILIPAE